MMTRTERQREMLGMPYGTAWHRLRKRLLFSFIQELERDLCHVCGSRIEVCEDMSVEHILPWENRSADLFWDLDNIAFSHRYCNLPHEYRNGSKLRAEVGEGESWCRHHQCAHPISEFSTRVNRGKVKPRVDCKRARVERHRVGLSA